MRALWIAVFATTMVLVPVAEISASPVGAAGATGTGVSYTLEGCRASVSAYLPNSYICPDSNYTTGNLGKGWNEFDLVPGRVILSSGNSAPATQDFSFVVAADRCSGALSAGACNPPNTPGYDQLSVLTLNSAESSASCPAALSGASLYAQGISGSSTTSIYRVISINHMGPNSDCVYDFYARLAFNSHEYSGSSLHYNLAANDSSFSSAGIGSKDVSIPVSAILPPTFNKTQTSTQGTANVWSIQKSSTPASFNFPNTCAAPTDTGEPTSVGVSTTIQWSKSSTNSGDITVQATINLENNAHREIDVSVSDQLYEGGLSTAAPPVPTGASYGNPIVNSGGLLNMAAGAGYSFTDTFDVPSGTDTVFSDVATATFTDPVFNQVLGSAQATAQSTVQIVNAGTGTSATITDVTSMTGSTNFDFSVDSTTPSSLGSFGTYGLGTQTAGPVTWTSPSETGGGQIVLDQTVYVLGPNADTGYLADTATLSPSGESSSSQASASSTITGDALVSIEVDKSMSLSFAGPKVFSFTATGSDGSSGSGTVTINSGTTGTGYITGLKPGVAYSISEDGTAPFSPQPNLGPVTVSLPSCSQALSVVNRAAPPIAQVQKLTNPGGSTQWQFTLTGVQSDGLTPVNDLASGTSETANVTANTGSYTQFLSNLDQDGATYTITETAVTNWDTTGVAGDIDNDTGRVTTSVSTRTCSFTLNLTTDSGGLFECTFTNTERGALTVHKTVNWSGITPDTSQTFQICITGPSYADATVTGSCETIGSAGGDLPTWTGLIPGKYTVTETDPGTSWTVSNNNQVVTVNPGDTGSTVGATITNTRKLGSLVVTKTINWTGPVDTSQTFQICITGPSFASTAAIGSCQTLSYSGTGAYTGGKLTWSDLLPGAYTVTEPGTGVAWTAVVTASPATVPPDGGQASAGVTNNENPADVKVIKTQNGQVPSLGFEFRLTSGANTTSFTSTLTTDSTNHGTLDFGNLPPGNYTLCEIGAPAGTHSTLQDPPYDGTVAPDTGNVCASFSLAAGVNQTFTIDNRSPGGNALTIGYWKHWNSYILYGNTTPNPNCTPNQTGNKLMDCFLPQLLGTYNVASALQGYNVLSNPSAKYAENSLAAQLLAAELNIAAGAQSCLGILGDITAANKLLSGINYAGPPSSKLTSKSTQYALAINLASYLNSYNNDQIPNC